MPDAPTRPPFAAYKGDSPYVFVSYAHLDGQLVFQELTELHRRGYRVWYDEGIDPGSEWPEAVANALSKASQFLVFISPLAVRSRNVRNEIYFALNNGKPFLAVYLKKTSLPPGLELRISDIQAVLKYEESPESYARKIASFLTASLIDSPTATHWRSPVDEAGGAPGEVVGQRAVESDPHKTTVQVAERPGPGLVDTSRLADASEVELVNVTRGDRPPFAMDVCMVSNRKYAEFLGDPDQARWNRGVARPEDGLVDAQYLMHWSGTGPDPADLDLPVVNISWHTARAYAEWRGRTLGRTLSIPSVEQWSAAVSGHEWRTDGRWLNRQITREGVHCANSAHGSRPIEVNKGWRNNLGIWNLLGNVFDMSECTDDPQSDWVCGMGGAYNSQRSQLQEAVRFHRNQCRSDVGFRCVGEISSYAGTGG